MVKNLTRPTIFSSLVPPNPEEVDYWIDLLANAKGNIIKFWDGNIRKWVKLTDASSEYAIAPHIGTNGNWFVENRDTGIKAYGYAPMVGDNDNWWQWDAALGKYIDTGVQATGDVGPIGPIGPDGKSAYEVAVLNGFVGTEEEWLASLSAASEAAAILALEARDAAVIATEDAIEATTATVTATGEALSAARSATIATANADAAADSARTSAIAANNAAASADTATNKANAATSSANSAATSANNAATNANSAAMSAESAATSANDAATKVEALIETSEEILEAAETATGSAITATENAITATTNANNAATVALDAAANVKDGKTPVISTIDASSVGTDEPAKFILTNTGNVDEAGNPIYVGTAEFPIGADGKAPLIETGTTTTGNAGTNANVIVTPNGSTADGRPKFKLDFTIPRGATGEPGSGSGNAVIVNFADATNSKQYVLKPQADGSLNYILEEADITLSDELSVVYVSKTGNDTNSGRNILHPKLTISNAITTASALITGVTTKASVVVIDAGVYTEAVTLVDDVSLIAEKATIIGQINLRNRTRVSVHTHYPSASSTTMLLKNGTDHAYYNAVISDGRGMSGTMTSVINVQNTTSSSITFVDAQLMFVSMGGSGIKEEASGTGHIHFNVKDLYLTGSNAIAVNAVGTSSNIIGYFDHILKLGTAPTNTRAIVVQNANSIVKLTGGEIIADIAYSITAGNLYMTCPKITGTTVGNATALSMNISNAESGVNDVPVILKKSNKGLNIYDQEEAVVGRNLVQSSMLLTTPKNTKSFEGAMWGSPIISNINTSIILKPNTEYIISYSVELLGKYSSPLMHSRTMSFTLFNSDASPSTRVLSQLASSDYDSMSIGDKRDIISKFNTKELPGVFSNYAIFCYTARYSEGFANVRFTDFTIQEASIPSDWSPAPEDLLNVTDVVDSLSSTAKDKPLSAAKGKELNDNKATKQLIPQYSIPVRTSEGTGETDTFRYYSAPSPSAGSIAVRTADGTLKVMEGVAANDAVAKSQLDAAVSTINSTVNGKADTTYVDNQLANKGSKLLTSAYSVPTNTTSAVGEPTSSTRVDALLVNNAIPVRTATGQVRVGDPLIDADATTKKYVDALISTKGNVNIINSPTVNKDVPYVIVPTANAAQTYNAVEAAVGGRNLLRNYNNPNLFNSSGGSTLTKSVVELPEFGITDANRVVSSGGTSRFKAVTYIGILPSGSKRVVSIRLKNNSTTVPLYVTGVSSSGVSPESYTIQPGTSAIVTFRCLGDGVRTFGINIGGDSPSGDIDFTWWRIMYEDGHIPSTPVPAPEDKLNVTDVINNLTSTDTNKPLSAAQGKLLQDNKASTTQLNSAISDFNTRFAGQYEIVSVLPAVGVEGKMYLVTTGTSNVYNLFTWKSVSGVYQWVDLGSTTVDLSQYAKSADVTSALSNKVDIVSGKGLSANDFTDEDKAEVLKVADLETRNQWFDTHESLTDGSIDVMAARSFTITASSNIVLTLTNLELLAGNDLRIRVVSNSATARTITLPTGVTNETGMATAVVTNVNSLELNIAQFGSEFIMKGVLYE